MKKIIVVAAVLAALSAAGASTRTAFFNGERTKVQTVTYKWVWRCGYRGMGINTFYLLFEDGCPSEVEVE